jgi:hypothetical protein
VEGACQHLLETAYVVTEELLLDAYRQQIIDQGVDPDQVVVRVEGEPPLSGLDEIDTGDDMWLTVRGGEVRCAVGGELEGRPSSPGAYVRRAR